MLIGCAAGPRQQIVPNVGRGDKLFKNGGDKNLLPGDKPFVAWGKVIVPGDKSIIPRQQIRDLLGDKRTV